jgi:hypothetical protein
MPYSLLLKLSPVFIFVYLCFSTTLSVTRTIVPNAWMILSAESKWSSKEVIVG